MKQVGAGGRMGRIRCQGLFMSPSTSLAAIVEAHEPSRRETVEKFGVPAFEWLEKLLCSGVDCVGASIDAVIVRQPKK